VVELRHIKKLEGNQENIKIQRAFAVILNIVIYKFTQPLIDLYFLYCFGRGNKFAHFQNKQQWHRVDELMFLVSPLIDPGIQPTCMQPA